MSKKYEFTDEVRTTSDKSILHRIKALVDFGDVHKGDIGGFIEREDNLSHEGNAWIYNNSYAFNDASVYGNAKVSGRSRICDNAKVFGNATVSGRSYICDNAKVFGNATVFGRSHICDNAKVFGNAILEDPMVCENASMSDNAQAFGHIILFNNAQVVGSVFIKSEAAIGKNAVIDDTNKFYTVGNLGRNRESVTFYRTESSIYVATESITCPRRFNDSIEAFEHMVKAVRYDDEYKEYAAAITFAKTVLK